MDLKEYIRTHPCKGFKPSVFYCEYTNSVTYYWKDECCFQEKIDDNLWGYYTETRELVGIKLFLGGNLKCVKKQS